MAKGANGEGSIQRYYQNGEYKGWRATVSYGYDDKGRLKRKQFYGKTREEVAKKMNEFLYKQGAGLLPADDKITLKEWFHTWLYEFRINDLKPSSFERYDGIYRNYILDSPIGNVKLVDLRAHHLQGYYNDLLENKSVSVVRNLNKILSVCLNEAVRQEYINKNYCKSITLPKHSKEESYNYFTLEEQRAFLKAIEGHRHRLAFNLALGTGLRLGELLALKWADIDFINDTLNVNKSIKRVTIIEKDGERNSRLIEQPPKNDSSYRTVPIPTHIITMLKKHYKEQAQLKKDMKEFYNDNDYIFCTKFGNPLDDKLLPRDFKNILEKENLRSITYHSLRHTYATRLFEAGVPVKTVQKLMGHSDITTTMNIYTHVMPEEKSKAVDKINELFITQP